MTGRRRRIVFWHRVDDPQSHLVAQGLLPIAEAHDIEVELVLVPEPAADVDPEPQLRARHDLHDARLLARSLGLVVPEPGSEPVATRVRLANAILMKPRAPAAQLRLAIEVGDALLRRDGARLGEIGDREGSVPGHEVRPRLEAGYARLRREGHYQGAVVTLDGEHFQGVLRLSHLRERLGEPPPPSLEASASSEGRRVAVSLYFSFRSPYSYLALERLAALEALEPIEIVLRPVMPMVMRGLPVPAAKRAYIVRDAAREARRHGVPFGRICDPVGLGIERCLAAYVHAAASGAGVAFARSAARGIWSEGADMTDDDTLRTIAQRAGLEPEAVLSSLADESYRELAERHREALYELGHWGVPVMQVGDLVVWGQDHLPLVLAHARTLAR